jgi:hypothetical protein
MDWQKCAKLLIKFIIHTSKTEISFQSPHHITFSHLTAHINPYNDKINRLTVKENTLVQTLIEVICHTWHVYHLLLLHETVLWRQRQTTTPQMAGERNSGSQSCQRPKYGHKSCGTWNQESLCWQGPEATYLTELDCIPLIVARQWLSKHIPTATKNWWSHFLCGRAISKESRQFLPELHAYFVQFTALTLITCIPFSDFYHHYHLYSGKLGSKLDLWFSQQWLWRVLFYDIMEWSLLKVNQSFGGT